MMGERTVEQSALFYGFSLERHVLQDHLLRLIDRFVDLSGIREHLRPPPPFHVLRTRNLGLLRPTTATRAGPLLTRS
jgi:hypothetical protein